MKTLLQCARTWIDFLEQTGLNPGSPVHVDRVSGTGAIRVNLGFVEGGRHNRVGYLNMSTKAGKGILDAPATAAPAPATQAPAPATARLPPIAG